MLAAVMVQGIVIALERMQQRRRAGVAPTPVSISVAPAVDETAAHVAAVAAAVYATLGAHRLVHTSVRRCPVRHGRPPVALPITPHTCHGEPAADRR